MKNFRSSTFDRPGAAFRPYSVLTPSPEVKKPNPQIESLAQEFLATDPSESDMAFLHETKFVNTVLAMSTELKRRFMDVGVSLVSSNLDAFKAEVRHRVELVLLEVSPETEEGEEVEEEEAAVA